ncbi:bifunctional adenosylcobinamide kinase/adenosylcobinamide-phosphate guanylyltransferase [Sinisalibacter aestuarii]|uniref:Bifunctional adenosylcobalamin biosynthesis protein n=1 Tax=Sinisalibacter aestuarii TaxID=2949426 RepID=A0ABQ5LWJ7_9RHOB|nr:bifunctional adenosylcobinamide kinase/adenosylcobinamide-phosphate guanylyltransferase [Sinisalibacter aestuarii]GKY89354.1 adenosylcobinamide kinase/adenosylcobinamide phosphate guanyltransferase [Sinisalibacter aestuarii]
MSITLPPLSLVIGGASSGKSAFAERLLRATGRPLTYIATAQAHDDEMAQKIAAHQVRRGVGWTTVEAPLDIVPPLQEAGAESAVLVDCATLWLANHLMAESDLAMEETRLLQGLHSCAAPVVVVTNEVGQGVVPAHASGRQFRNAQGRLNQSLAAQAGLVVLVVAGLPMVLKGTLPEGFS